MLDVLPANGMATAWRDLAVSAENPFATPEWLASWLEIRRDARPLILACRSSEGSLVGVVPLVVDTRGRLSSPGDSHVDWYGPACAPRHEADVAVAVVSALDRSGHLKRTWTLTRCLTSGGWIAGVRGAHHPEHELIATNTAIELSLVNFSKPPAISGKDRREIARLRRRLSNAHRVEFGCAQSRQEAEVTFPIFEHLYSQRWSNLRTPEVARFHRSFALRAAEQGWLRLWTLTIDGQPAAALYGWRIGARSFAYMQAFDVAWSRHGVGVLLLDHAVRAAGEEGSEVFDMLRGQERHKARFENEQRTARTFVFVGRGSFARLVIRGRQSVGRASERLPRHYQAAIRQALFRT